MSEHVYLYSYGKRRHIKDPNGTASRRPEFSAQARCGGWFDTDKRMADTLKWWKIDDRAANEAMDRKRAEPICKRCERLAAQS